MKHHKHLEIDTDYRDTKNPTTAEISHKKKDFGYKHCLGRVQTGR